MPMITRQVPTGTITDADALRLEINADLANVGSLCGPVAIRTGNPNDTIEITFANAHSDAALDSVIAAFPSVQHGLVPSANFTDGVPATVWERPLAPGEDLHVDATITVRLGGGSDVESSTFHVRERARRRTGEGAVVAGSSGSMDEHGEIPQGDARLVATGNKIGIQIAIRRTATGAISGTVNVKSEVLP